MSTPPENIGDCIVCERNNDYPALYLENRKRIVKDDNGRHNFFRDAPAVAGGWRAIAVALTLAH